MGGSRVLVICDLVWSTLKQLSNLNDIKLEINVICKLEAEGLFERHFNNKIWSFYPINVPVPLSSAEVHCFQIKFTKDINLVF